MGFLGKSGPGKIHEVILVNQKFHTVFGGLNQLVAESKAVQNGGEIIKELSARRDRVEREHCLTRIKQFGSFLGIESSLTVTEGINQLKILTRVAAV